MEKAIRRAIKGGYRNEEILLAGIWCGGYENINPFVNGYGIVQYRTPNNKPPANIADGTPVQKIQVILLDPLFWQCLGKAERWNETTFHREASSQDYETLTYDECWKMFWHSFINHLISGGDVDSFFNKLLK